MGDILIDNKDFYNFELNFLTYFSFIIKLTVILFIIGVFENKPTIITNFNFVVKLILAIFLIYRFNKYRKDKIKFTELDRKVSYSAGVYILLISFISVFNYYIDSIRTKFILPITQPAINFFKTNIYDYNQLL
jgi:uncharacterized membrane protein YbhN (UPF0104 family)